MSAMSDDLMALRNVAVLSVSALWLCYWVRKAVRRARRLNQPHAHNCEFCNVPEEID